MHRAQPYALMCLLVALALTGCRAVRRATPAETQRTRECLDRCRALADGCGLDKVCRSGLRYCVDDCKR